MGNKLGGAAPGSYGPAALTALLLSGALSAMAVVGVAVLLPQMAREFSRTPGVGLLVQLAGAMAPTFLALSAPVAGRLVDRLGCRAVYIGGLVFFAAAGALPFLLHDLYLILVCRAVLGMAAAAVLIAALGGLAALPDARRARLLGFQTFIGGFSAMSLYPVVGLISRHDWRGAFLIHLVALLLIPLAMSLPGRGPTAHVASAVRARKPLPLSPALLGVAALTGMIMFIGGMFAPLFLPSIGVTEPAQWAIPPMIGSGVGLLLSAGYGWLHGRLSLPAIFAAALAMAGGGLLISGVSASLWLFTIGAAIEGAGVTLFTPALSAAAIARAGEGEAGRAVGLANGALFCSQAIFPFISTPLAGAAGPRAIYLVFGAAALLIGFGYLILTFRTRGGPAAATGAVGLGAYDL